jgi:hypothetical protein
MRDKTEDELRQDIQTHLPSDSEAAQKRKTGANLRISAIMHARKVRERKERKPKKARA